MKKMLLTINAFLGAVVLGLGQQEATTRDGRTVLLWNDGSWLYADSALKLRPLSTVYFELPDADSTKIVFHTAYSLLYNEAHEQADWVAYMLTKATLNQKTASRTNHFITDPMIKTQSAENTDYVRSGYDRGHLAPAADMAWSAVAMKESFYYSNMSPQAPGFNRGIWSQLEGHVRKWAMEYDTLYVVTGPILREDLQAIGPNKVSVPEYFYKVILHYTRSDVKGIGFILPNTGSTLPLQHYAVSIDSVQKATGIRFFPKLPEKQESVIKRALSTTSWNW